MSFADEHLIALVDEGPGLRRRGQPDRRWCMHTGSAVLDCGPGAYAAAHGRQLVQDASEAQP